MKNKVERLPNSSPPRPGRLRLRPTVYWSSFPQGMCVGERFRLALEAGFEGVDGQTVMDKAEVEAIAEASAATGILIPSVVNLGSLRYELFSDDPTEVALGVDSLLTTLDNARIWGAGVIHLIPAYLRGGVSYQEAYRRTQQVVRERILPVAEEYGIVCGVENAWDSIVQGPLEYVRFIDEFESPFIRAFLDTGNMIFGHTEEWIRLAGRRIVRLHVKDFRLDPGSRFSWRARGRFSFGRIGEGAVNWNDVSAALRDVGYDGWGTCGEHSPRLPVRILNKAGVVLSRNRLSRRLGVDSTLERMQSATTLRSLNDSAQRLDRFLR